MHKCAWTGRAGCLIRGRTAQEMFRTDQGGIWYPRGIEAVAPALLLYCLGIVRQVQQQSLLRFGIHVSPSEHQQAMILPSLNQ